MKNIRAKRVLDLFDIRTPGAYKPYTQMGLETPTEQDSIAGLNFWCPCGQEHLGTVVFIQTRTNGPEWQWDHNADKPTVTPSIHNVYRDHECWHGHLTDGEWVSC